MKKIFELGDTVFSSFSNMKGFVVHYNRQNYFDIKMAFQNLEIAYTTSDLLCESRIILLEKFANNEL